ncbi:MAG: PHB depolymerase family esterase [Salinibacter sp.]|uniref:alpha/beta hydrolase family esterase n=1 Tax=Salinibacter sp. TaxID=2065818 RepID=UPI0035D4274B
MRLQYLSFRPWLILILAAFLAGCGGSGSDPESAKTPAPGWHEETLRHGGLARHFRFYVPEDPPGTVPIVVVLHGGSQSMNEIFGPGAGGTREWTQIAEEEGALLLAPNGTNLDTGSPSGDKQGWNDCRPEERARPGTDDVDFIAALLDWTAGRFADTQIALNAGQTLVTGASNGGMMTYRLATELPGRFAAAAAFIANRPKPSECPDATDPVPMLIVNGTEDPLMPYEGGSIAPGLGGFGTVASAEATRDYWVDVNRADTTQRSVNQLPNRDPNDGSVVICENDPPPASPGAPVQFCRVEGGGHIMPSIEHRLRGRQNHDVEGARLAWSFFRQAVDQ